MRFDAQNWLILRGGIGASCCNFRIRTVLVASKMSSIYLRC